MMSKSSVLQPHVLSSTYAYLLVVIGIWSYFETGVKAEFVTVIFGVVLLIMNNGVQYGTKEARYVALITTVLSLLIVFRPLAKQIEYHKLAAILRTSSILIIGGLSLMTLSYSMFFAKRATNKKNRKGGVNR